MTSAAPRVTRSSRIAWSAWGSPASPRSSTTAWASSWRAPRSISAAGWPTSHPATSRTSWQRTGRTASRPTAPSSTAWPAMRSRAGTSSRCSPRTPASASARRSAVCGPSRSWRAPWIALLSRQSCSPTRGPSAWATASRAFRPRGRRAPTLTGPSARSTRHGTPRTWSAGAARRTASSRSPVPRSSIACAPAAGCPCPTTSPRGCSPVVPERSSRSRRTGSSEAASEPSRPRAGTSPRKSRQTRCPPASTTRASLPSRPTSSPSSSTTSTSSATRSPWRAARGWTPGATA